MAVLARILAALTRAERFIAALCIGLLTLIMFADVGARELFKGGIAWAQKFSLNLMFWAGMLGVVVVSSRGTHIRPEIGEKLWPEKLKPILKAIEHFLIALFCAGMAVVAVQFVIKTYDSGQRNPVTEIPMWILQLVLPYTFISLTLRHAIYAAVPALRPADKNEAEEALEMEKQAQEETVKGENNG